MVARWADQDKDLLFPLFQLIASGEPIEDARLAGDLGRGADAVDAALNASPAEFDTHGRVTELFGITREPTLHRIEVGGEVLYSCCALVAHIVPAILRESAAIESTDPVSGSKIKLAISADFELQLVDPMTAYASMVDCAFDQIIDNPRNNFCCHVKHFATSESAAEFCGKSSDRYVMTIADFHEAARWLYRRIWR